MLCRSPFVKTQVADIGINTSKSVGNSSTSYRPIKFVNTLKSLEVQRIPSDSKSSHLYQKYRGDIFESIPDETEIDDYGSYKQNDTHVSALQKSGNVSAIDNITTGFD